MLTRYTLTFIAVSCVMNGFMPDSARAEPINVMGDQPLPAAASPDVSESQGASADPASEPASGLPEKEPSAQTQNNPACADACAKGSQAQPAASAAENEDSSALAESIVEEAAKSGVREAAKETQKNTEQADATGQPEPVELSGPPIQSVPAIPVLIKPPVEPKPAAVATSRIAISHSLVHSDDGSTVILTIDGKDAGTLKRGEVTAVEVKPGTHKVGGYVRTLFGLGRVTIPSVDVSTASGKLTNVNYTVIKDKPGFKIVSRKQR